MTQRVGKDTLNQVFKPYLSKYWKLTIRATIHSKLNFPLDPFTSGLDLYALQLLGFHSKSKP